MKSGIIVINLDRSVDRLAQVRAQLERHGLDFHRLSATDARTLPDAVRPRYYSEDLNRSSYHKQLSPGEIACYISHLRACEHLLTTSWDYAVVLEDDVRLNEHFTPALALIPSLPPGWDLLKLGAPSHKPIIAQTSLRDGFSLCAYTKTPACTHAQVISRAGAEKILRHRIPFGRPADVDLQFPWENSLIIHGLEPYTTHTDETLGSEIWKNTTRRTQVRSRLRLYANRATFAWNSFAHNIRQHGLRPALKTALFGGLPHP